MSIRTAYATEYNSWRAMRERCRNKNYRAYHRYGGRGISICERWDEFSNFLDDMGNKPTPKHELDRIDNDGNYEPSNCRWASGIEQRNNTSKNVRVTIDGVSKTVSQWCRHYGIARTTPHNRMRDGWDIVDAITIPVNKPGKNIRNGQAYRKKPIPDCANCGKKTKHYSCKYCSRACYIDMRFHQPA